MFGVGGRLPPGPAMGLVGTNNGAEESISNRLATSFKQRDIFRNFRQATAPHHV